MGERKSKGCCATSEFRHLGIFRNVTQQKPPEKEVVYFSSDINHSRCHSFPRPNKIPFFFLAPFLILVIWCAHYIFSKMASLYISSRTLYKTKSPCLFSYSFFFITTIS